MACLRLLLFVSLIIGPALGQETSAATDTNVREPRSLKKKLCYKYGICGGGQEGGYQGGQQGGYQGYQGVPINIAISQSQSSANGADGGHANGYYPNNYQYNGGYPSHSGYNQGYHNQGYGGYPNQDYGGYHNPGYGGYQGNKPGYFGNGPGSSNSQFNGNFYGGERQGGGYGFQRPFGQFYDEESGESREDGAGFGFARSLAVSESKA